MKQIIFTIYDDKAAAYLPPFFLPNKEMAIRTFRNCLNDNNHQFCQTPQDYTLFEVGEFENTEGLIIPLTNKSLGNGLEIKTQSEMNMEQKI